MGQGDVTEDAQASLAGGFGRQNDCPTVDAAGEVKDLTRGRTAPIEDERSLGEHCLLDVAIVFGNDDSGGPAEGPLDLGTAVVEASIVPIDHQRDAVGRDVQGTVEDAEADAGVPESDQVCPADEEDLVARAESEAVENDFLTEEIRPDVENDVAITLAQLGEETLEETSRDPRAHLRLGHATESDAMWRP